MKKFFVYFALFIAVFFVLSCGESEEDGEGSACTTQGDLRCNGNMLQKCDQEAWKNFENCADSGKTCNAGTGKCESGNGDTNDGAGIHLGIIGFNNRLETKDITRLTNSNDFINFIENHLSREDNTALYYAVDNALEMMKKYNKPPKLENVALVTFTDGMDNQSINLTPGYSKGEDYLNDLHNKIINEKIHGLPVQAYTIGFRTKDEIPDVLLPDFEDVLKKLASNGNNFSVSDMKEVKERFAIIADNLSKVSKSIDIGVYMPAGYDDGLVIRYSFDDVNVETVENSTLYIEGTFRQQTMSLENISYHGFKTPTDGTSIQSLQTSNGSRYFLFQDLRYSNGESVPDDLYKSAKLWKRIKGSWVGESEINMANLPPIVEVDMSSALIVVVLDCTTSLTPDNFRMMKDAAEEFVRTLANVNGNGGGSGNNTEPTEPTTPSDSAKEACYSIYECMVDCGSDGECQQACLNNGTAEGQSTFMAMYNCWDNNGCFDAQTQEDYSNCVLNNCYDETDACGLISGGGSAAGDTSYASPYGSAQINISSTYIVTDADGNLGQEMVTMGSFISGNYGNSQIVPAAAAQSYYYTSMYTEDGETMMQTAQYFTDSTGQNILNPFVIAITNVEASVGSNYYGLLDQNGVGYIMLADVTVSGNSLNLSCYHAFSEGELTVQNLYAAAGSAGALAVSGTVNLYSPKNYANGYGDISDQLGVTVCSPK